MSKLDEFFNGSLVSWIKSLIPQGELFQDYHSLTNGDILNKVWNLIDPPDNNQIYSANQFTIIVQRMKSFYEDRLGQIILTLPDCSVLGNSPQTLKGLDQMKLLLKLFLGAAVQCPRKEYFINCLKRLNVETQFSLVDIIKKVTDNESFVLTSDSSKQISSKQMFNNLRRVTKERSMFNSNFLTEIEIIMNKGRKERNFLEPKLVELYGIKSQIRKIREQFEEKCEDNLNLKEDLKFQRIKCEKLKIENQKWFNEAKLVSIYRDEIDYYKERSDRTDQLENEIRKNKENLNDLEFYKTRVNDLREDYQILLDEKQNLERELKVFKKQNEELLISRNEALEIHEKCEQILLDRKNHHTKLQEMEDTNNELHFALNENNSKILELNEEIYELKCMFDLSEQSNKEKGIEKLSLKLVNSKLIEKFDELRFDHRSQLEKFNRDAENLKCDLYNTKHEVLEFQERETCLEKKIEEFKDDLKVLREHHSKLENEYNSLYILHEELKESKEVVKKSFGSNLFTKFKKSRDPCLQNKLSLNAEVAGSRKAVYIIHEDEQSLRNEIELRTEELNDTILSEGGSWKEYGCI